MKINVFTYLLADRQVYLTQLVVGCIPQAQSQKRLKKCEQTVEREILEHDGQCSNIGSNV